MEENNEVQAFFGKFINEAEKTIKLIEALKTRADDLVEKENRIADTKVKQTVRKQAIAELAKLTEKLVAINTDLKIDYVDSKNFVIPYFTPGDNTIYKLIFVSGDNPWNFWLVDKNVDTKETLKNLMKKFQSGLLDPIKTPQAAQSVCFIDRNKVVRGIIIQIKNENRIKLVDCDSNVTKLVTIDKLYKLDEEACSVHASAIRCTITEEPDEIELWKNSDLRDLFCNTLRESTLTVKILKRVSGSFPMFVVDVELKNEDDDTASLTEWILDRLLPELKEIKNCENDSICDFLSEESLSPFCKKSDDKKEVNNAASLLVGVKENETISQNGKVNKELNNLNLPSEKFSEKVVSNLNDFKAKNKNPHENTVDLENKGSISSEDWVYSSDTSSRESLVNDCSQKAKSDGGLYCDSEEFFPTVKKTNINKNQDENNAAEYKQPLPTSNPAPTFHKGLVPPLPPRPCTVQPIQQATPSCTYSQPPTWAASPDCRVSEVNVLAPEFVPRKNMIQQPNSTKHVEFPKELITLRKSATLINENENFQVLISHVENPSEFYIHFLNKNNKHLDKLLDEMSMYYSTREKVKFVSWQEARSKLGQFCACLWRGDNKWYRVEVLEWCTADNLVKVWFVDHGNTDCVPLNCLQPLNESFGKLMISCQACHLATVHPITKGQPWSEEAIRFFKQHVEVSHHHLYSVKVVQCNETSLKKKSSLSVFLYDNSPKSINEMLVDRGLAWSRVLSRPASSASSEHYHSMDDVRDSLSTDLSMIASNLARSAANLEPNVLLQNCYDEFQDFDPMKDDFESVRNNPALDIDDACVAVTGYSARDESRICQFYASEGKCFKAYCTKEHIMLNSDGTTTDKEETPTEAFSRITLPQAGEVVKLKVTYVYNFNIFFAQLEEKKGVSFDDEFEDNAETLTTLVQLINSPVTISTMKRLAIAPDLGQLVLAKEPGTDMWYRARVISASDNVESFEVMFVDYGSTCVVTPQHVRKMENRFLHLPFQAIECSLANITPIRNNQISMERGVELLQDLLLGEVFTAKIYRSIDEMDISQLEVLIGIESLGDLGTMLVENGFAIAKELNWSTAIDGCSTRIHPA